MFWSGWPVEVMKTDWSVAYKHISVCNSDHRFQMVEFGGCYFVETALTFGGCNSPTLYNMVARLLIELAALESGLDLRHSCQRTARVGSLLGVKGLLTVDVRKQLFIHMIIRIQGRLGTVTAATGMAGTKECAQAL